VDRVAPLFISTGNAEACTGQSWRWCRDMARALGVPLLGAGKKQLVDAAKFRAALEGLVDGGIAEPGNTVTDPAEQIRQRLGLRVVAGGGR